VEFYEQVIASRQLQKLLQRIFSEEDGRGMAFQKVSDKVWESYRIIFYSILECYEKIEKIGWKHFFIDINPPEEKYNEIAKNLPSGLRIIFTKTQDFYHKELAKRQFNPIYFKVEAEKIEGRHNKWKDANSEPGKFMGELPPEKGNYNGTMLYDSGRKYEGSWKDGMYEGRGMLYDNFFYYQEEKFCCGKIMCKDCPVHNFCEICEKNFSQDDQVTRFVVSNQQKSDRSCPNTIHTSWFHKKCKTSPSLGCPECDEKLVSKLDTIMLGQWENGNKKGFFIVESRDTLEAIIWDELNEIREIIDTTDICFTALNEGVISKTEERENQFTKKTRITT
jgi:hypothetical protein